MSHDLDLGSNLKQPYCSCLFYPWTKIPALHAQHPGWSVTFMGTSHGAVLAERAAQGHPYPIGVVASCVRVVHRSRGAASVPCCQPCFPSRPASHILKFMPVLGSSNLSFPWVTCWEVEEIIPAAPLAPVRLEHTRLRKSPQPAVWPHWPHSSYLRSASGFLMSSS